jgi:hypothetical protein
MAGLTFPGDNDALRREVVRRVNAVAKYRQRFARVFPEVRSSACGLLTCYCKALHHDCVGRARTTGGWGADSRHRTHRSPSAPARLRMIDGGRTPADPAPHR